MDFLKSVLIFAGVIIIIFAGIEYWREADVIKVVESLFSPKYIYALIVLIAIFSISRLILPIFFKLLFG